MFIYLINDDIVPELGRRDITSSHIYIFRVLNVFVMRVNATFLSRIVVESVLGAMLLAT